jgi:hypothetical protein
MSFSDVHHLEKLAVCFFVCIVEGGCWRMYLLSDQKLSEWNVFIFEVGHIQVTAQVWKAA